TPPYTLLPYTTLFRSIGSPCRFCLKTASPYHMKDGQSGTGRESYLLQKIYGSLRIGGSISGKQQVHAVARFILRRRMTREQYRRSEEHTSELQSRENL